MEGWGGGEWRISYFFVYNSQSRMRGGGGGGGGGGGE